MNTQTTTEQTIATGLAVAAGVAPLLPPNVQIAIAIAAAALAAVQKSQSLGSDISDADLQAIFDQFEVNEADDLKAQAEALQKQTAGTSTATGGVPNA